LTSNNPKFWLEKRSHRKTGYLVGTIAYYGPNDKFASKVVVGIILSDKDEEVTFIERWFGTDIDARIDPEIKVEIVNFLQQHDIHRVAMIDKIIGCPHEEGIDYPKNEKCPQCPFWANRDRWTGEIIS